MIVRMNGWLAVVLVMALGSLTPTWAQAPAPGPAPAPAPPPPPAATEEKKPDEAAKPDEQKPKTLWDEFKLFSYIEIGSTFNLHGGSIGIPGSTASGYTNLDALLRHLSELHVQHRRVQHQA